MVHGGDRTDWLFLAMVHSKLGHKEQARKWYDLALQQMPSRAWEYPLRHEGFRAEAAMLLGIDRDQEARDSAKVPAKN